MGAPDKRGGDAVRKLLLSTRVVDLQRHLQPIAIMKDSSTVEQALQVLAARKIVSVPVVVTPEQCEDDKSPLLPAGVAADILGFLDIRDIVESFLASTDLEAMNADNVKLLQRMRILEEKGAQFGELMLKELRFMGTDGDFLHLSQANSTLLELVTKGLLQPRNTGSTNGKGEVVHRIALFDNAGCITQIISQSDIIRFLVQYKGKLGPVADSSVEELGLISNRVEGVHPEAPAIEAMKLMSKKKLSSLAVLDANGQIVGNFSTSDLRTIVSEHFGALALPVGEYLAHEHKTEYVGFNRLHEEGVVGTAGHRFVQDRVSRQRPRTPGDEVGQALVLAKKSNTLGEVMELLVKHRIHRIYVVDDETSRPVGIITCTDILRKLLEVTQ